MYLYIRSFKERITWRKALPHVSIFFLYFIVSYNWVRYLAGINPGSSDIPVEGFQSPFAILFMSVRYAQLLLPAYHLSQALNEGLHKNFYELVNGYRVEEAKRLLADQDDTQFTILSAGLEAGFNSKTTFNTVFKKFTGLTPSQFRNQALPLPATA